jgi:nucleotide-binding universal stress UspA family protein
LPIPREPHCPGEHHGVCAVESPRLDPIERWDVAVYWSPRSNTGETPHGRTPAVAVRSVHDLADRSLTEMGLISAMTSNGPGTGAVVCGMDGSSVACEALRTAGRLADALGLRLVVEHVVAPVPVRAEPWTAPAASFGGNDLASGQALLERVCAEAELPDAERRIAVGRPAERLAELADEEDAELIVVGSRRHRLLRAAFVGGVSSELIGLATCPVLVIPAQALSRESEDS